MTNAVVKGILFIAFLQTALATLTLWLFGIKAWLLWGMVMLILSVIPFAGTGIVLIPSGIIKIMAGDVWQGIAIICISVGFISMIDNVLRPRIIGQRAGMHDLLVFFSIIGGIFTFGPAGFIIGPLFAAVFLTILEIYKIEFQSEIEVSKK
jgi:predicted PurR-regulated permease PerM